MVYGFSTTEIQTALGIKPERFRAWIHEGFLVEPKIPAAGKGSRATYSIEQVYCIALFKNLLETGFNRKTAARCVSAFWNQAFNRKNHIVAKIRPKNENIIYVFFKFLTEDPQELPITMVASGDPTGRIIISHADIGFDGGELSADRDDHEGPWEKFHIVKLDHMFQKVDLALKELAPKEV